MGQYRFWVKAELGIGVSVFIKIGYEVDIKFLCFHMIVGLTGSAKGVFWFR